MSTLAPEPGWYTTPGGETRWWDGERWGAVAPSPQPNKPRSKGATVAIFTVSLLVSALVILPIIGFIISGLMGG